MDSDWILGGNTCKTNNDIHMIDERMTCYT